MKQIKIIGKIVWKFIIVFSTLYTFVNIFLSKPYIPKKDMSLHSYNVINLFNRKVDMNNLNIIYKDKKVNSIYLNQYLIKNNGNVEIKPDDYIENIKLIGDYGEIFDIDIVETSTTYIKETLKDNIHFEDASIILPKVLLNSNDYYIFSVISERIPKNIKVSYAISGINHMEIESNYSLIKKKIELNDRVMFVIMWIIVAGVIGIVIFVLIMNRKLKPFRNKFHCSRTDAMLFSKIYYKNVKMINMSNKSNKVKEKQIQKIDNEMKKLLEDSD